MSEVEERLAAVQSAVARASAESSAGGQVELIAVTKTVGEEQILQAYRAGQRAFAENRVQEGLRKIESLKQLMPDARWHLIGHLQTNKVRSAVTAFQVIESIDSLHLAESVSAEAERALVSVPILIEINIAGEGSKTGFTAEAYWKAFPDLRRLPGMQLRGLMTVAPLAGDTSDVAWVFQKLRELRDTTQLRFDVPEFRELSMGMSNDFEVAIREGATMIRVGRAIFGERPPRTRHE